MSTETPACPIHAALAAMLPHNGFGASVTDIYAAADFPDAARPRSIAYTQEAGKLSVKFKAEGKTLAAMKAAACQLLADFTPVDDKAAGDTLRLTARGGAAKPKSKEGSTDATAKKAPNTGGKS